MILKLRMNGETVLYLAELTILYDNTQQNGMKSVLPKMFKFSFMYKSLFAILAVCTQITISSAQSYCEGSDSNASELF